MHYMYSLFFYYLYNNRSFSFSILPSLSPSPPVVSSHYPVLILKGSYHCIESLYSSATNSQPEDKLTELYSSCPLLHLLDYLTTCKVSIVTDPIGLQLVLQSLYSSTGHGNERGTFPRLAPPDVPPSAKKRCGKKVWSLDEGERVCVVIVESLLLMMVRLERGPLYMINQLLTILSGVDIKVRNTCTVHVMIVHVHVIMVMYSTCNCIVHVHVQYNYMYITCTCTCIALYTIFTICTLWSLPFSSSVS